MFNLNPLTLLVPKSGVVYVSTVNLNSTILFNEDLIEEICVSTEHLVFFSKYFVTVLKSSGFQYIYYTYH